MTENRVVKRAREQSMQFALTSGDMGLLTGPHLKHVLVAKIVKKREETKFHVPDIVFR